jgi:diguanylate cyclase (GGDEF)-like protein/PAS domain S-box-containing protein
LTIDTDTPPGTGNEDRHIAGPKRRGTARPLLPLLVMIGLIGAFSGSLTLLSLDFISATRAFVTGESHWSRAQQNSVFLLDRFAEFGRTQDLEAARAQFEVPRAAREARFLLDQAPVDQESVRDALLRVGVDAEDVPSMVRLYRYFSSLDDFQNAILLWERSDAWIERLEGLAAELESLWATSSSSHATMRASIREELALIDQNLARDTLAFASSMSNAGSRIVRGSRWIMFTGLLVLGLLLVYFALRAMRQFRRFESRFWTTFEQAPIGMGLIDADSALTEHNRALARLLQRSPAELDGQLLSHFSHPRDRSALRKYIGDRRSRLRDDEALESRYVRPDGTVVWGKLSLAGLHSSEIDPELQVVVLEDISESHRLAAELAYQAAHDQLTGLPNRREFERGLNQLLHRQDRRRGRHALCLIDLDQFKVVNDSFGHLAGDALLVRLTERMSSCLRDEDLLARLDGDEFGILLRDCSLDTAIDVLERIRGAIADFDFQWEERPVSISASMGLVPLDDDDRDAATLLQQADMACHEAKDLGRNRMQIHSADDGTSSRRHEEMDWVQRINQALTDDRLKLHAQLIQPVGDASFRCELLLRLVGNDGELHTAAQFMEAAERFHIARNVDRWVIEHALAAIREQSERLPWISSWHINLSGQSVDSSSMLPEIVDGIRRHGVDPKRLCFEVTETAAIRSLDEARSFFDALRVLGCEIALDDFGKGLSTFDYLKQIPVDLVKIDGGFVRELLHSELDHAMVRSIHEIARIAGLKTVAESVESMEVQHRLRQIGIDFLQGHIIHNPCPLHELHPMEEAAEPLD